MLWEDEEAVKTSFQHEKMSFGMTQGTPLSSHHDVEVDLVLNARKGVAETECKSWEQNAK